MRKLTTKEFIDRAVSVHGNIYDYCESEYINATTKIKVKCKKHGYFYILPHNHFKGEGCPLCRYEKAAEKMKMPLDEFINRAKNVHGDKYDYSKVEYINNRIKVCIICPKHGEFWQAPHKHIFRGHGCPHCSGNAKRTTESFINDATIVHGIKYDYSKVIYEKIHKPVCIICPEHGEFWQAPNDHLHGQGCPHCKQSKIEKDVFNSLVKNGITFESQYKYDENNLKSSIDFFIPNVKIGIECQGEQHFNPVDFASKGDAWANELFEKNIERDKHKHLICEKNGIMLFYYVPIKNVAYDYKSDEKFCGIYTNDNVYTSIEQLNNKIKSIISNN